MLRRKRDELTKNWEEREQRLEKIRTKEKRLEERAAKRRRVEKAPSRENKRDVDEETEFLLDRRDDSDPVPEDDPLSMLSKETRLLMERVGFVAPKAKPDEEDEDEEEIKVGSAHTRDLRNVHAMVS